jgi:hypothetical protein
MRALHFLLLATFLFCIADPTFVLADNVIPQATAVTAPAPAPVMTPVPPGVSLPAVAVAEPSAPPQWAQDIIVVAEKLPLVGPIVAKVMLWAGILSGILTTLVGAVLGILQLLLGVFNLTGLVNAAAWIAAFRDGKVMYWLKFFSMFNAKKPQ